jgi:RecA-family ATPase
MLSPQLHWHSNNVPPEPRWLVKKLLPEMGVGLLSGQWSTGKTFMALHLANRVWTGEPFAGRKIKRRGGTLYFAAEAAGDIPIRLRAIAAPPRAVKPVLLPFTWIDEVPKLSDANTCRQLIDIARRQADSEMQKRFGVPLALIIVDTMSAAAGLEDENSAAHVQPVMDVLHQLAKTTGTLVIAIDHIGKSTHVGTRGSSAKESSADAVLTLEKGGNNSYTMTVRKLRSGPTGQKFEYSLEPISFGTDGDGDEITTCIVSFNPQQVTPATKSWNGAQDLKQAIDAAKQLRLNDDLRLVEGAKLAEVRAEFYKAYPAIGDEARGKPSTANETALATGA